MRVNVNLYQNASSFAVASGEFLRSRPVEHNPILTLLEARLKHPEPGRYWVAAAGIEVQGVVFQSPLTRAVLVVPMKPAIIAPLVDAIAESGAAIPGITGEAATAARFAGRWSELGRTGEFPVRGLRLYQLASVNRARPAQGNLHRAEPADRDLAAIWLHEFEAEVGEPASDAASRATLRIAARELWLWKEHGNPVSMAAAIGPVEGVVRIGSVYTPPEHRRRGYAEVCVYALSKHFSDAGCRCILYTDLGNPTSNSIYRRIGYKAVAEAIHYRFGQP